MKGKGRKPNWAEKDVKLWYRPDKASANPAGSGGVCGLPEWLQLEPKGPALCVCMLPHHWVGLPQDWALGLQPRRPRWHWHLGSKFFLKDGLGITSLWLMHVPFQNYISHNIQAQLFSIFTSYNPIFETLLTYLHMHQQQHYYLQLYFESSITILQSTPSL